MIHSDHITHIDQMEDKPYLRTPLFDVNMRLFRTSDGYRGVVLAACGWIEKLCLTKMEGYKLPHGMSGANAGVPWNIIGIARNRGQPDAHCDIMINPEIVKISDEKVESQSNCGSLCLPEPITIKRHVWVEVTWYDANAVFWRAVFDREHGGLTIQHEVDHNLGILITDRT